MIISCWLNQIHQNSHYGRKKNKEVSGPARIMKRVGATYPGLSCLYYAVVTLTRFSPLPDYHQESNSVINDNYFGGYNNEIIDHPALHFQIKHTGKVLCIVSVILELPFVDVSFPHFLCNTVRFRITKSLTRLSLKNRV